MDSRDDSRLQSIEIRRYSHEINQLKAYVRSLRDLLEICDHQSELRRNIESERKQRIDDWNNRYRRRSEDFLQHHHSPIEQAGEIDSTTPIEQIRRLDQESEDLAILATELGRFMNEEMYEQENSNEADILVVAETQEEEEEQLPPNYIRFLIVDEQGRPLGQKQPEPTQNNAQSGTAPSTRTNQGYLTVGSPSSTVWWQRYPNAIRQSGQQSGQDTLQLMAGQAIGGITRSVSTSSLDSMRTAVIGINIGFNDGRDHVQPINHALVVPQDLDDPGIYYPYKTMAAAHSGASQANKTPQTALANAVLTDQNKIVYIPIVGCEEKPQNPNPYYESTPMSACQRLWQDSLNASSGQCIWYSVPMGSNTDSDRTYRPDDATPLTNSEVGQFVKKSAGRLTKEEKKTKTAASNQRVENGVPVNVQRSLLHKILGKP